MSDVSGLDAVGRQERDQQHRSADAHLEMSFGALAVGSSPALGSRLNRDLLIGLGHRMMSGRQRRRFIDINFFKSFYIDQTIRNVALDWLSRVNTLTIDSGQARLMDRTGKVRFYLDFQPLNQAEREDALEYLEWIVDLMRKRDEGGRCWIAQLHVNSSVGVNARKLARILRKLRGITHLHLPYELDFVKGDGYRKMLELVEANADSLVVLKHVTQLAHIPHSLAQKAAMINHASARNGLLAVEQDFFAVYARGENSVHMKPVDDGVLMRMKLHRMFDVFHSLDRNDPITRVVTHIVVTIADPPDLHILTLLQCFGGLAETLPHLRSVEVQVDLKELDPTADDEGLHDPLRSLVPYMADTLKGVSSSAMRWLQTEHLPFDFALRVHLIVGYATEPDEALMLEAANETIPQLIDVLPMEMTSSGAHGVDIAHRRQLAIGSEVSPAVNFEVQITFRPNCYGELCQDEPEDDEGEEDVDDQMAKDGEKAPGDISETDENDRRIFGNEGGFL